MTDITATEAWNQWRKTEKHAVVKHTVLAPTRSVARREENVELALWEAFSAGFDARQ